MWIVQICLAAFWYYLGIHLLFREAKVWASVGHIPWFRRVFRCSSTRRWELFCRDAGLLSLVVGCLLFLQLPFGIGTLGVMAGLLPLVVMI